MSQVRTLAVERIGKRIGRLAPEDLAQVLAGLDEIIGDSAGCIEADSPFLTLIRGEDSILDDGIYPFRA